eukprot:m.38420 g.38420  ORF g.38420 m.38420 type:complete len:212 (+) comp6797_c0_seq2:172-807(+)
MSTSDDMDGDISRFSNMKVEANEHRRRVAIVLKTWGQAVKSVPEWHELFFTELSHREPKVFGMYSFDVSELSKNSLYRRHIALLRGALEGAFSEMADNYESTITDLIALGERHYTYGVESGHVLLLIDVFIWLLSAAFNTRWEKDTEDCWKYCLGLVGAPVIAGLQYAEVKTNQANKLAGEAPKQTNPIPARNIKSVDVDINGSKCQVSVI